MLSSKDNDKENFFNNKKYFSDQGSEWAAIFLDQLVSHDAKEEIKTNLCTNMQKHLY